MFRYLSSMPFAIFLLCILAIASVVGTLLQQGLTEVAYIAKFGPFWFSIFQALELFDVYHAVWFVCILFFLVLSTSLCVIRHSPSIFKEIKSFRLSIRHHGLTHLPYQSLTSIKDRSQLITFLNTLGFHTQFKDELIAAKKGAWGRLGYILAHVGLVLLCIGGLIDSNLMLKFQQSMGWKIPELRSNIAQIEVPNQSRLASDSISFRGNVDLSEGSSAKCCFS
jgi:cytochrome c biogenesis protein